MILVTGATGTVGRELLAQLAEAGRPVRAMTRRPRELLVPPGAEVVYGDADDPGSLDGAFQGVDTAFLMSAQPVGAAPEPTHDLALVAAALRAGVTRVAKLSVFDAGERRPDVLGRWHAAAEDAVINSGMAYTLLRPGRFMTNTLHWSAMIAKGDTVYTQLPDLATASIDPADIAAVAAAALTTGAHDGVAYRLTGPEALSPAQEAELIGKELGRELRVVEPPAASIRTGMIRSGMSEEVVDTILTRMSEEPPPPIVLPTVAEVLGRPATPFTAWLARHRTAFTR